jgi:hypothetical protein
MMHGPLNVKFHIHCSYIHILNMHYCGYIPVITTATTAATVFIVSTVHMIHCWLLWLLPFVRCVSVTLYIINLSLCHAALTNCTK